MAQIVQKVLASSAKIVLSGCSQGAEQVHGALVNLRVDGAKIAVSDLRNAILNTLIAKKLTSLLTFRPP
jgi:hypothetical protein